MSAVINPVATEHTLRDVSVPARRQKEVSPRTMARWGAALLLATILGGVVAQGFLADKLVVAGDAAATARNIVANQSMLRAAYAIFMIEMACQIATTAVMYQLLMPVDRTLAKTAAAFGYVGSGIKILSRLFFYAPLFVLGGSSYFASFNQSQLEAIAYLLIRINNLGAGMACIFLGVNTMLTGYLTLRSGFLPRALGVIGLVGGAGWLGYLYPPLASAIFLPVVLFALLGCAVTIGWLMIRGVDEKKWHEMAAASASSVWR